MCRYNRKFVITKGFAQDVKLYNVHYVNNNHVTFYSTKNRKIILKIHAFESILIWFKILSCKKRLNLKSQHSNFEFMDKFSYLFLEITVLVLHLNSCVVAKPLPSTQTLVIKSLYLKIISSSKRRYQVF